MAALMENSNEGDAERRASRKEHVAHYPESIETLREREYPMLQGDKPIQKLPGLVIDKCDRHDIS